MPTLGAPMMMPVIGISEDLASIHVVKNVALNALVTTALD
jgi:hypothetical protein